MGTGYVWLLSSLQQQDVARSLLRPAKRTRALLESNPRRNNRLKTHRNDGRRGKPNSLFGFLLVHRTDRSSYRLFCCPIAEGRLLAIWKYIANCLESLVIGNFTFQSFETRGSGPNRRYRVCTSKVSRMGARKHHCGLGDIGHV